MVTHNPPPPGLQAGAKPSAAFAAFFIVPLNWLSPRRAHSHGTLPYVEGFVGNGTYAPLVERRAYRGRHPPLFELCRRHG
ncbi:hypothetical protein U91I_01104 [alpha proteobacterium U9-1i]|nr:hypothetical protein U91I_01104 [alpha proteobacterium U9-1i]